MHRLTDTAAIATWERAAAPDPNASGPGHPYRCTGCDWTGRGETALRHYRETGHAIRGRDWPASWPNAVFSCAPNAPFAVYAHDQPDFNGGTFAMFNIVGGPHDRSTVSAETLRELGIEVRK